MEAWGEFLPIRADGTFRLTRMYVSLAIALGIPSPKTLTLSITLTDHNPVL